MSDNNNKKIATNIVILAGVIIAIIYVGLLFASKSMSPQVKIYFYQEENLKAVSRSLQKNQQPLKSAIQNLLDGPTSQEAEQGYFSLIPVNTKAISINSQGETAVVDFTKELGQYGGGSSRVKGMLAQIVYTLTDLPKINNVEILINGNRDFVLGGEGYVLDEKISRKTLDF